MDNIEAIDHSLEITAGISIIEGLYLSPEVGGRYDMICLQVKVHGSDGASARAVSRLIGKPSLGRTVSGELAR